MIGNATFRFDLDWNPVATLIGVLASVSRYDLIIGVIPLVFVVALAATGALDVATHEALAAAAIVGVLALVDAIYLNPPTQST